MNRLLLAAAGLALVGLGMAALVLLGWRPAASPTVDGGGPQVREVLYAEEPPMTWDAVAGADVLDVHDVPGAAGDVTAVLLGRPAGIESTGRIALVDGVLWRELTLPDDVTGWADARLLVHHRAG